MNSPLRLDGWEMVENKVALTIYSIFKLRAQVQLQNENKLLSVAC